MKNLIVPIAGKSTRFSKTRPKWLLTHPKGLFMMIEGIKGINIDFFDKIFFVTLKDYQEKYQFEKGLIEELELLEIKEKTEIIYLEKATSSQSETIYQAIKKAHIEGFIMIKDCDNYFECKMEKMENQICFFDLNKESLEIINPRSKSYLELSERNELINIVEKKIISSFFSVGGYCFKDSRNFAESFERIRDMEGECYVSNIIYDMLLRNELFRGIEVEMYKDWGTLADWDKYKKSYQTIFIDLDGTLIEQSSYKFFPYIGNTQGHKSNIEWLRNLYKTGEGTNYYYYSKTAAV